MPLGNLTSQFFANFYLNELDYFVKHHLKLKYYIRYVDDFVILHTDQKILNGWKDQINTFLDNNLKLELHPDKTKILALRRGITFLGFRIFTKHRLLKKSNAKRIWKRLYRFKERFDRGQITRQEVLGSLEGWLAYAEFADTYKFRLKVMAKFNELFGS